MRQKLATVSILSLICVAVNMAEASSTESSPETTTTTHSTTTSTTTTHTGQSDTTLSPVPASPTAASSAVTEQSSTTLSLTSVSTTAASSAVTEQSSTTLSSTSVNTTTTSADTEQSGTTLSSTPVSTTAASSAVTEQSSKTLSLAPVTTTSASSAVTGQSSSTLSSSSVSTTSASSAVTKQSSTTVSSTPAREIPSYTTTSSGVNISGPNAPTYAYVQNVTENSFRLAWTERTNASYTNLKITLVPAPENNFSNACKRYEEGNCTIERTNTSFLDITGLEAGTKYDVYIYGVLNTEESQSSAFVSTFTKPLGPKGSTVTNISHVGLTVTWNYSSPNFDKISFIISPSPLLNNSECSDGNCTISATKNTTSYNIDGLTDGTNYSISIYTMKAGLLTDSPDIISSFTKPLSLSSDIEIYNITQSMFSVKWEDDNTQRYTGVRLTITPATTTLNITPACTTHAESYCSFNRSSNVTDIEYSGLDAGTLYEVVISTEAGEQVGDGILKQTYTRPDAATNVSVRKTTNSSIEATWHEPLKGGVDNYTVSFSCLSPNKFSTETRGPNTTNLTVSTANNLDPGTACNVTIITNIGDQSGDLKSVVLKKTADETAPGNATFSNRTSFSRSILVEWKRPATPNGIIRKYRMKVKDGNCTIEEQVFCVICEEVDEDVTCNDIVTSETEACPGGFNLTSSVNSSVMVSATTKANLHPYRNYSVSVQAYTRCWGEEANENIETDQDVPDAAPEGRVKTRTSRNITVEWNELEETHRNGIITNYTLYYTYENKSCFNSNNSTPVRVENINVSAPSRSGTFEDLRPYWFYTFFISAWTVKGMGNFSLLCNVRTQEDIPGSIDNNTVSTTATNTTVDMTWEAPCETNGIITNYTYRIDNLNEDYNDGTVPLHDNETQYTINNLLPYRNYSIAIAANTAAGQGDFTAEKKITTKIDCPYQPNDPNPNATDSTSFDVTWEALPQLNYTGPTTYTVVAIDAQNNSFTNSCHTFGYNSTRCFISGLEEYWNYTVTVTATTACGNRSSDQVLQRTKEGKPGKVANLNLTPESNVTLSRSILVRWDSPKERDLNGVIQSYYVVFEYMNDTSVSTETFSTHASQQLFKYFNIRPGSYNVTIYAETSAGNGTNESDVTNVLPGAPLPPVHDIAHPLVESGGAAAVADDKKQFAVQIDKQRWLCNESNGIPEQWGVIVAQDGAASGSPWAGSSQDYKTYRQKTYKKWSEVKDLDTIPPYIASGDEWNPHCGTTANSRRRKRSIEDKVVFIVGADGECLNAQNNYCNGELPPGRRYRVKTYVCTSGGCSESDYSIEIFITAPNLLVPIVAGIVSAIVVIGVALGVVIFLKRREKVCFAKRVEVSSTHVSGNEIALVETGRSKSHVFKPGPVKLTDFPAFVERMHKDTDLLFADAYKMLRENSPKHSTSVAEQQICRPKNRYTDILPFDHTRVKLLPVDDVEGSDYINANYIPGYTSPREYIACQGPMIATFDDFWRMVWEQNVDTIVMLTKLVEKGRRKCDQYWPELGEPVFYGDLVVSVTSESNMSDYTIRIFEVKLKEQKKTVRQFCYLKWPDMGCPDTPELLLDFVKAVRQYNINPHDPKKPMVVHCSAGVGRTGTFIVVDTLLQHIRDHDEVDIYQQCLDMRQHRARMVQTEDQYVYVHECLKAYLTTDEDAEADDEQDPHIYENYPGPNMEDDNPYVNTAFTKAPE